MTLLLAASPILVSVALLLVFRQSGVRAGVAGLAVAIAVVLASDRFALNGGALGLALLSGALTTLIVAYVLFGGLVLFRILEAGGALRTIADSISRALPDPDKRTLTLVLGLSVFFESATGFGIGIIVSAPLFLALGFSPYRAALLALSGQCAVPWGALAIGTTLGAELTGVSADWIGTVGAPMNVPLILICGGVALYLSGGWAAVRRCAPDLLLQTLVLAAVLAGISYTASVEIAGIAGGLVVTAVGLLSSGRRSKAETTKQRHSDAALGPSILPFAALLLALLGTRLVPPLHDGAQSLLVVDVVEADFRMSALYHPGFWLLVSAVVASFALGVGWRAAASAVQTAADQWFWATAAVAGYICFSQVMFVSGMTVALASAVSDFFGRAYIGVLPFVGGLGGFMTASNAGSNAMFAQFQFAVGERIGIPGDIAVAAQNAGGANTNMASPGRIILAATVTGRQGEEARLMRPMLLISIAGLAVLSAGLLIWT